MPKTDRERHEAYRQGLAAKLDSLIAEVSEIHRLQLEMGASIRSLLIRALANESRSLANGANPKKPQPKRSPQTELSQDWTLTDNLIEYTRKYGLDPELVLEDFKNYWCGTGKTMASWAHTYMRWVRETVKRNEAEDRRLRKYSNGRDPEHTELPGPRPPTTPPPTLRELGLE